MNFGRKVALFFVGGLFSLLLFLLALDIGLIRIVGQPQSIKGILNDSGIYNSIVPGLLSENKQISSSGGSVPLSDPIVRSAAESTLTPTFLRTNINQAIDSIYAWLDGKVAQPGYSLNTSQVKSDFADKVAAGVSQRASGLPACTSFSPAPSFDEFSAACLPRGVTPAAAAEQARQSIISGKGFLDQSTISASDIKANNSNKSVFEDQLKNAPAGYRRLKESPLLLLVLSLLALLGIVFIYVDRLKGARHAGFILLSSGVLLILIAVGLNKAVSNKVTPGISFSDPVLQKSLRTVANDVVHTVTNGYKLAAAVYIVLGAVLVGGAYFLMRRAPTPATEVDSQPAAEEPNTADKPSKSRGKK